MYDYLCEKCGERVELIVPYAERNDDHEHDGCGGTLKRTGFTKAPGARQLTQYGGMQAVVVDRNEKTVGHVKGHFGKEAKRNRK